MRMWSNFTCTPRMSYRYSESHRQVPTGVASTDSGCDPLIQKCHTHPLEKPPGVPVLLSITTDHIPLDYDHILNIHGVIKITGISSGEWGCNDSPWGCHLQRQDFIKIHEHISGCDSNLQGSDLETEDVIEVQENVICRLRIWSKSMGILSRDWWSDHDPQGCHLQMEDLI